jgi:hypothetical protein
MRGEQTCIKVLSFYFRLFSIRCHSFCKLIYMDKEVMVIASFRIPVFPFDMGIIHQSYV